MAQYLFTLYYEDQWRPTQEEFQRSCADVPALDAKMQDAGVFVFHGGLPPQSQTVVRPQSDGDFLITDGPYPETKEHLGGFWIIDVADLDAALDWAKLAAVASRRPVEVAPLEMRTIDELLAASAAGEL